MKFLYQFSAAESFLHKVDPRSKMLFLAGFLVSLWILPLPYPPLMAIGMVLLIWMAAGIGPTEYLPFILFLLPIMFSVILIQILTGPPPHTRLMLGSVELIPISRAGLDIGLKVAFRLAAMGIGFIGFSMTTDPFHWGMSLYRSGVPYKVSYMFGFAMRFFPLLQEEMVVIGNALRARASDLVGSKNPVKFLKYVGQLVIPLGISALRRSQTIALAMELRGYNLPEEMGIERTLYREVAFAWRDTIVWLVTLIVVVLTVFAMRSVG